MLKSRKHIPKDTVRTLDIVHIERTYCLRNRHLKTSYCACEPCIICEGKCFQCGKRLLSLATEASSQTLSTVIEGETQTEPFLDMLCKVKNISTNYSLCYAALNPHWVCLNTVPHSLVNLPPF